MSGNLAVLRGRRQQNGDPALIKVIIDLTETAMRNNVLVLSIFSIFLRLQHIVVDAQWTPRRTRRFGISPLHHHSLVAPWGDADGMVQQKRSGRPIGTD